MLGLGTVYCEDDEKLEEARQVAYRPTPLLCWVRPVPTLPVRTLCAIGVRMCVRTECAYVRCTNALLVPRTWYLGPGTWYQLFEDCLQRMAATKHQGQLRSLHTRHGY